MGTLGRTERVWASLAFVAMAWGAGCGSDADTVPATTTSSSTTSSSSGSGGAGGVGGAGGEGGTAAGGAGGAAVDCLPAAEHTSVFTIDTPALCLVGKYTGAFDLHDGVVPSWGTHDGPLTMERPGGQDDLVSFVRWWPPSGATGQLAKDAAAPIDLGIVGGPFEFVPRVENFYQQIAVAWRATTGSAGEVLLVEGSAVAERLAGEGIHSLAPIENPYVGLLLHTGLTPLEPQGGTPTPAAYLSTFCESGDPLCTSAPVVAQGDAPGLVVVDGDHSIFMTFPDTANSQTDVRATSIEELSQNQPPSSAVVTVPGSIRALAGLRWTGTFDGYLLLQPVGTQTGQPLDVMLQLYSGADKTITPSGTLTTALTMTTPGTPVSLLSDRWHRLWLAVSSGSSETTFYVLTRI